MAKSKKRTALTVLGRILLCLLALIEIVVFALLGVIFVLERGPSERARDLFVISMNETSAAKFVPTIFLSQQEVDAILAANTFQETDAVTDTELVVIAD